METQPRNPIQELKAQAHVRVLRTGGEHDWVIWVDAPAQTAGPAMDPVEVWADHHDGYEVTLSGDKPGKSTAYYIDRVA